MHRAMAHTEAAGPLLVPNGHLRKVHHTSGGHQVVIKWQKH